MKRLLTSCFGLGYLPIAPGTWGSLPIVVIFGILCFSCVSPIWTIIILAISVVFGSLVCVKFGPELIEKTGKSDPGEVVADEFAGQAVAFIFVSLVNFREVSTVEILVILAVGFLVFRLFDILKPWPIRKLEKFPNGWGILADDLLAGIYAGILLLTGKICGLTGYIAEMFG